MTMLQIKWRDHYSSYGWFSPEDSSPVGHINVSVGLLVEITEDHTTIAQTMHEDGSVYADLLHILNKEILTYKELN